MRIKDEILLGLCEEEMDSEVRKEFGVSEIRELRGRDRSEILVGLAGARERAIGEVLGVVGRAKKRLVDIQMTGIVAGILAEVLGEI